MASGKQLDTIVYPPNKPDYSVSGLLMDYPLEKLFEWCFFNWVLIRHHIFWETGHFWEFQMKETKKEIDWKENTLASKGKGKGNDWKTSKNHDLRKAAGHNSVPSKQTTLFCIRVAHGLPPWKIVWVMCFNWVLIRHHIFWETGHFWEFQMKETKKGIN